MMNRGLFSSILNNEEYKKSDKEWIVELQRYHMYWYDLVVNPGEVSDYFNTKKLIVNYLRYVKRCVEESLEKRFIYFICSRTKVRFNLKKKPTFNPITRTVKIHILLGGERKKSSFKVRFYDESSNRFYYPNIVLTEKYITITDPVGNLTTASVHDFLSSSRVSLGLCSNIEYVGYTENPHSRPTNGAHTGLNEVLYKVSNESFDTLIYFNVFKVTAKASSDNSMLNFMFANSMTDEIGAELEGKVIEKCFILYFDSDNQTKNKEKERSELTNNLLDMVDNNKINAVHVGYGFEEAHDYVFFSSSAIPPSHKHIFNVRVVNGELDINKGSGQFEAVGW
ncbi:MAG: hypothetical protein ABW084_00800 [Candidatus Thiodiazotropha sp.]